MESHVENLKDGGDGFEITEKINIEHLDENEKINLRRKLRENNRNFDAVLNRYELRGKRNSSNIKYAEDQKSENRNAGLDKGESREKTQQNQGDNGSNSNNGGNNGLEQENMKNTTDKAEQHSKELPTLNDLWWESREKAKKEQEKMKPLSLEEMRAQIARNKKELAESKEESR